jgi:glycine cleavage system H protein
MPYQVLAPETEPCVWMCAGHISYKLCDRGFDCENCPLDAALRGQMLAVTRQAAHIDRRTDEGLFPGDRLFSPGHLWVQAMSHDDARIWRVGLDAFATALIGCATGVHCITETETLQRGDPICEVDLGMGSLKLSAPVSGRFVRANRMLQSHPAMLVTEPYGEGWLLELEGLDPAGVLGLRPAPRALEHTEHDLRRFRRTLALRLLSASGAGGAPDPAESLRDLRQVLCGAHYAELLSQFVH